LPNRVVDILASSVKQITSVLMIFVGSLLAANTSSGPCGGTSLAAEPIPAIFVAILGLELILCSYFPVKRLAVESSFRAIIYLFLLMWSLGSFVPAVRIAFPAMTGNVPDTNDLLFSLLRGVVAVANLVAFYRWTGIRNIITRTW
jgi:hypothetical protein